MSKQYAIVQPDGSPWDTGSLGALEDAAQRYVDAGRGGDLCYVGRATKTCLQVVMEAQKKRAAWLARKEETHVKVSVLHGSSASSYVKKWVRK